MPPTVPVTEDWMPATFVSTTAQWESFRLFIWFIRKHHCILTFVSLFVSRKRQYIKHLQIIQRVTTVIY